MTIDEAIAYYGSGNKLCAVLGIKLPNLTQWRKRGFMPLKHQHRVQALTDGKLIAGLEGRK